LDTEIYRERFGALAIGWPVRKTTLRMSQLHAWARALGGEEAGGQVLCPGPGHSASDRSLSVKIGKDGQPVVYSHAGDDWKLCRDHVLRRLGLERFKPNGARKTVAAYEFCDPATGDVRYRKERVEGADGTKAFYFKPAGRNGSEPLLYGGERLADLSGEQPIFVVEGEKKVDRLRELGAVAVSADSGASSKWLPPHADLLRGLQIILWPEGSKLERRCILLAPARLGMTGARRALSLTLPIKIGFGLRSTGNVPAASSRLRQFTHGRKSEDGRRPSMLTSHGKSRPRPSPHSPMSGATPRQSRRANSCTPGIIFAGFSRQP
jgi:hypothetical protein